MHLHGSDPTMKLATAACVAVVAAVLAVSYGPERPGSPEEIAAAYVQVCNNFFYLTRFFRFPSPILLAS